MQKKVVLKVHDYGSNCGPEHTVQNTKREFCQARSGKPYVPGGNDCKKSVWYKACVCFLASSRLDPRSRSTAWNNDGAFDRDTFFISFICSLQ
jgi:hypothetical protein